MNPDWERRSAAARRAVATKGKKYRQWPTSRGPRSLKPLIRVEALDKRWMPSGVVVDCPQGCRGVLHQTHESSRFVGGGAAALFKVRHETWTCSGCRGRWQVKTITEEEQ